MEKSKKLELIAEALEYEAEDLAEDMLLEDIDTWDSVAVLSVISIMNDQFNKFPNATEIRAYKTIGDLLNAME